MPHTKCEGYLHEGCFAYQDEDPRTKMSNCRLSEGCMSPEPWQSTQRAECCPGEATSPAPSHTLHFRGVARGFCRLARLRDLISLGVGLASIMEHSTTER